MFLHLQNTTIEKKDSIRFGDKVLLFLFCIYAIISSGTLSDSLAAIHNLSLYARSQMVSFHVNQDRIAFPYLIRKNQFCRKCLHMFL